MANTEIEKVLTVLKGFSEKDADLATKYLDTDRFLQHNPRASDGVDGLKHFIARFPREQLHMKVVRAFQDGPYVVTQAVGQRSGQNIFLDIFRFESGLVVEHWAFGTSDAPPNESGHTQTDGPTGVTHLEDTEQNKALVRDYYETIHVSGQHDKIPQYFSGDHCIRHEPGARWSLSLPARPHTPRPEQNNQYDRVRVGAGRLCFYHSERNSWGYAMRLHRLVPSRRGRIAERWGFPEEVPPQEERRNHNGML